MDIYTHRREGAIASLLRWREKSKAARSIWRHENRYDIAMLKLAIATLKHFVKHVSETKYVSKRFIETYFETACNLKIEAVVKPVLSGFMRQTHNFRKI